MYEKVMVPIDRSEVAMRALDEAIRLAGAMGSTLRIVHAVNATDARFEGLEEVVNVMEVRQKLAREGNTLLAEMAARARQAGVQVETDLLDAGGGGVARAMSDEAERCGATLIVLGTHARTGFQYLLMGSMTEELLRLVKVPMLIIKGD